MATIDYISDWATRMRSRLYTQFRDASSWQAFSDLLASLAQDWEDAAQTVLSIISIDDSSGVQLDTIGRIVGQPRIAADDATYRSYLKARVLANKSEGTAEQIYKVLNALLGAIGLIYINGGPKQFILRIVGAITASQASIAKDFIGDSKEAGARAILEWQIDTDDQMFCFDGGTGLGFGSETDPSIGGKFAEAFLT